MNVFDFRSGRGRRRIAAAFTATILAGLIAIAALAGSARAATPRTDLLDYRAAVAIPGEFGHDFSGHGDPDTGNEYVEPMADICYKPQTTGGTVELHVSNPTGKAISIVGVKVDGQDADALTDRPFNNPAACAESDLRWWRAEPTEIPEGGSSVVALNGTHFAPGSDVRFEVQTDAGSAWVTAKLRRPSVRIGAVRFSQDLQRVRIYLEPRAGFHGTLVPAAVRIGSRSIPARYRGSVYRGRSLLVTARVRPLTVGRKVSISVPLRHRGRKKSIITVASAAVRAFPSRFPVGIGVGFGSATLPSESDSTKLRAAGIDTLVAFDQAFSFDDLLTSAHVGGFSTVIGSEIPGPGETHADTSEALLQEMPRLAQDPSVTAFYPYDEPDIPFAEPVWRYRTSAYLAGLIARVHAADRIHPSFVNLWSPNAAAEYGAIPDIGGWDHYPLGRASLALESASEFARTNRAQTSPNPFWFWSQAMPFEQGRLPSAAEMRVYNGLAVAGGATGLIWFTYEGSTTSRPEWDEISSESTVLAALRHQLAEGYVYSSAGNKSAGSGIDVSSIAGPGLSFLAVSNLDYRLGGTSPSQFTSRSDLGVTWKLPPWLVRRSDLSFAEVTPGVGLLRLGSKQGLHRSRSHPNRARLDLDQLESARWFIAAPARRINEIAKQLNR